MSQAFSFGALFAAGFCLVVPQASDAALVLQAKASGYNPQTGVLTPSAGSPTLTLTEFGSGITAGNLTPNGSASLRFNGSTYFAFNQVVSVGAGNAVSIFAFVAPSATSTNKTIVSGDVGSPQYRFNSGLAADGNEAANAQDLLRSRQVNYGHSSAATTAGVFSSVNVVNEVVDDAATAGRVTFRNNGVFVGDTGSTSPAAFGNPFFSRIGGAQDGGGATEMFNGDIVEVRIYDTQLTTAERAAVEAEFIAAYVTTVPEPTTLGLLGLGAVGMLARRRKA